MAWDTNPGAEEIEQDLVVMLPPNRQYVADVKIVSWQPAGGENGAVLEVFNAIGESIAGVTVPCSAVAPLRADQVPAVRRLAAA